MNFKLGELEELFAEIKNIVDYIEFSNSDRRNQLLFLSNGDRIPYKINKENIPHLLGINMDYLKSTRQFSQTNNFELLKEFIDSAYKVNNLVNSGILNYNHMFSKYLFDKIRVFNFNTKLNIYETELVCKYDVKKTYALTEKNEKFDYIIVKKDKTTGAYGILCIVKQNSHYVPMSSLYFKDYKSMQEKLKDLIQNQEITLFSGSRSTNDLTGYSKPYKLPVDIKAAKLSNLQRYKSDFNCIIDTSEDFKYLLNDSLKHKNEYFSNNDLIENAINSISAGILIDVEPFLNTGLLGLVQAYNDYLCSHAINSDSEISESYSKVISDRNAFKTELEKIRQELEEQKQKNKELEDENKKVKEENNHYKETNNAIIKLLKPSE